MVSRKELVQTLTHMLTEAGIPDARLEARFLLEERTGMALPQFLLHPEQAVSEEDVTVLTEQCKQRCTGYPLQYLLGNWDFYGLTFRVGTGVLIPRADTETLVDVVCDLRKQASATVLTDLCSGSGCIPAACAAALPNVTGTAVEFSPAAMCYLQENLSVHAPQMHIIQGDVLQEQTADAVPMCDVLTCNPPYLTAQDMQQLQREVTFEPETALYGGDDGLDFYRRITALWKSRIRSGGWLVYEIGMGQEADVLAILQAEGFVRCFTRQDAAGIVRVVAGQQPEIIS